MSNYAPYYEGGWKNEEEMTTTPICAEALNHIENGIAENAEAIAEKLIEVYVDGTALVINTNLTDGNEVRY